MRRLLITLTTVILASISSPYAVARADNGPHGVQSMVTDSCAGCHRAHTAQAPNLLAAGVPQLCLTCHDGSGATTNVEDGVSSGRGLKGGGFASALMDTNWDGVATSAATTSSHLYDGSTNATLWGGGAIDSGPGTAGFKMSCVSCHDPHGGAGNGGSATYRLLRLIPTGSGATTGIHIPDEAVKRYTVTSAENKYFGEAYFEGDWVPIEDLAQWCTQCHTRYDAVDQGTGHTSSGDPIYKYRHMTRYPTGWIDCELCHNVMGGIQAANPFGIDGGAVAHEPACENCHVAHGSSARMGTYGGSAAWPDGSTAVAGDHRSSLLRLDNRGVCMGCHAR